MTQHIKTILAVLAVGIGLAVFTVTLVHAVWYAPEQSDYTLGQKHHAVISVPKEYPSRLTIPSLGIDAKVQYVGVNAKGNMGVPSNFTDVAWYQDGTLPGQIGSAVIDGHVDNGLGLSGVFKHLADINVGDEVKVVTTEGKTLNFVVSDIKNYPFQSVPTDAVFNAVDGQRLNLITCEGAWVAGQKTYDHRLVVYTTLVRATN
jgi:sortase (surface protein transpeptidase)